MNVTKYHAPRNFRDLSSALSYKIYGFLKNSKMTWVPLTYCHDYIVTGGNSLSSAGHKAHVWCAGYDKAYGKTNRPQKIHSVRGPLSQQRAKQHMNLSPPCAGDPLILIKEVYDTQEADLKPCVFEDPKRPIPLQKSDQKVRKITTNDSLDTILTSIRNASFVITNLIEGLAIADSFKVPSSFYCKGSIPFEVRDYVANFSNSSYDVVEDVPDFESINLHNFRYRNIEPLKSTLLKTIPEV